MGFQGFSRSFCFRCWDSHRTVCTQQPLLTTLTATRFIAGTDFTAAYLLPMPTNPRFVFTRPPPPSCLKPNPPLRQKPPPCWLSFLSPKFACQSLLRHGPPSGCQRSEDFLVWGSALPFILWFYISHFFGDSLVSGSVLTALWHIALLKGVCWNSGSCVSMRNAPDTEFKVHSLLLLFSPRGYEWKMPIHRSTPGMYPSMSKFGWVKFAPN